MASLEVVKCRSAQHELRPESDHQYAVAAIHAAKSYGQHKVFVNVNMRVEQGTIYALLGPSGCGKTSLLRCLIGRLQLDGGTVLVFGQLLGALNSGVPGRNVGYMPQETSIHHTLTIFECWMYYGTLLGLTKEVVSTASSFYVQLLGLPSGNTLNGNLSGGELRRVAFATALIHRPKLLILDEPTVGIDPITKHRMWQHLIQVTIENGTSVILTTHYIEEAMSAQRIGMMHDGTLAIEGKTTDLLNEFNCTTLEDVFLMVCCGHTLDRTSNVDDANVKSPHLKTAVNWSQWTSDLHIRWYILHALVIKNFIHLYRFPGVLLMMALLPSLQLLTTVISHGESFTRIPLMVVNDDSGPLGGQYLDLLDKSFFDLKPSEIQTVDLLTAGHAYRLLEIPRNFTDAITQRISSFPLTYEEIILTGTVHVFLDNVDVQISQSVIFYLMEAFQSFQWSFYNTSGLNPILGDPIIRINPKTKEHLMCASSLSIIIVVMTMAAYYSVTSLSVLNLFSERTGGHLECSRVAGVSSAEILLSMSIVQLCIALIQILLLTIVSSLSIYNVSSQNWPLIFALLFWHGITGMSFGFLLSAIFDEIFLLLIIVGSVLIFTSAISGYFWPIQAAPYLYQGLVRALPHFYTADAINALLYWGQKDYSTAVILAFFSNSIWFIIFMVATMVLLVTNR